MTDTAMQLAARVGVEQRVQYVVTPQANALMTAESLGGQLSSLSKLFAQLADADGYKVKTMIGGIAMREDGSIAFDLIIMPLAPCDRTVAR